MMTLLALLWGWLGVSTSIALAAGLAYLLIPDVPWLTSKVRHLLLFIAIGAVTGSFIYGKGAYDAAAAKDIQLEKAKTNDIKKATTARRRIRINCARTPVGCVPSDNFRD